jgi:beta-N-acetylhexosaminidase
MDREIHDIISKLGTNEKAALRLLIDLPQKILDEPSSKLFSLYPWTGVILFPKNIEDKKQTVTLIQKLQIMNAQSFPDYPLFISVDQEGGSVSPLEKLMTPSPGNMALTAARDSEGVSAISKLAAKELKDLGFNVNFAPVMDVNTAPENPIIGIRSFGSDPEMVAELGCRVIRAYQGEGVMAVAKHFPGHGDTIKDSHLDLPVVNAPLERISKVELYPFEKAVQAGVWGMMTAHVIFPCLDTKPATLSRKILTELLRKKMNFQGVIFTDSFSMAAIREHFDLEEAVKEAVLAGSDVLLALGDDRYQLEIFQILKDLIKDGGLPSECVDDPIYRILSYRKKLALLKPFSDFVPTPHLTENLHEKAVTILKGEELLPVSGDFEIFLSPDASVKIQLFKEVFPDFTFVSWPWEKNPDQERYAVFFGERRTLIPEVVKRIKEWNFEPYLAISFGNPYLLHLVSTSKIQIATYHINSIFVKEASKILLQGKKVRGKLPVPIIS